MLSVWLALIRWLWCWHRRACSQRCALRNWWTKLHAGSSSSGTVRLCRRQSTAIRPRSRREWQWAGGNRRWPPMASSTCKQGDTMQYIRWINGFDLLLLEGQHRVRGQVGHVQRFALFHHQRMLLHQQPAHVGKEKAPVDVVPGGNACFVETWDWPFVGTYGSASVSVHLWWHRWSRDHSMTWFWKATQFMPTKMIWETIGINTNAILLHAPSTVFLPCNFCATKAGEDLP